ncbi:hypothetical protein [Flavobacterium sp.]|uniref:hypothetical protein n=1 Tax=Flavobacterium sp. TaxID=239 RepID=UPI003D0E08A4
MISQNTVGAHRNASPHCVEALLCGSKKKYAKDYGIKMILKKSELILKSVAK